MAFKKNTFISTSNVQTQKIASILMSTIKTPCLITLSGHLGSGKTTFVKGLAKYFNINKTITSPTFTLLKQYHLTGRWQGWTFYHFDLYRLKDLGMFYNEGFPLIFHDKKAIIVIEWPELISAILPKKIINIQFSSLINKKKSAVGASSKTRVIKVCNLKI